MSILSVIEVAGRTLGINQKGDREAERRYKVQGSTKTESAFDVRTAAGLPLMFSEHPDEAGLRVVDVAIQQVDDNPYIWEVTVKYSSVLDNGEQDENPLNQPAVIEYSSAPYQRVAWKTIDNVSVTNSAGMFYDPPVMMDDSRPVIRITKNKASFDASLAMAYQDAINTDSFLGIAPYCCKVASFGGRKQFKAVNNVQIPYWEVTLEVHCNFDTWWLQVLDQGYFEYAGTADVNGKPVLREIRYSNNGNPVNGPTLLNGSGVRLADGGTPVFRTFRVYRELSFASLGML